MLKIGHRDRQGAQYDAMRHARYLASYPSQNGWRGGSIGQVGLGGLGQWKAPFQDEITQLARSTSGKCFTSQSILPAIRQSMQFAQNFNPTGLSSYGGTASPEAVKRAMQNRYYTLQYWDRRLAAENPQKTYCPGFTDKIPSTDRTQVINAITGPYVEASGAVGAAQVVTQAWNQLLSDITLGFIDPATGQPRKPPWYLNLSILVPGAVGLIALAVGAGIYGRVRHGKGVIPTKVRAPESAPACKAGYGPKGSQVCPPGHHVETDAETQCEHCVPNPPPSSPSTQSKAPPSQAQAQDRFRDRGGRWS